jgi:hypothetical protein
MDHLSSVNFSLTEVIYPGFQLFPVLLRYNKSRNIHVTIKSSRVKVTGVIFIVVP